MGFNTNYFECQVDPVFLCCRCNYVLVNPIMCGTNGCHGIICSTCLPSDKLNKTVPQCPLCRQNLPTRPQKPHWQFLQRLHCLPMRCTRKCGTIVRLGQLPSHLMSECPLTIIMCPNRLRGCKVEIKRREFKHHLETCDYQRVACEVCGFQTLRNKLIFHQKVRRCYETKLMSEKVRSVNEAIRGVKDHQKAIKKQAMRLDYQIMKTRSHRFEELCGRSPSVASTLDNSLLHDRLSSTSTSPNSLADRITSASSQRINPHHMSSDDLIIQEYRDCLTPAESVTRTESLQRYSSLTPSNSSSRTSSRRSMRSSTSSSSLRLRKSVAKPYVACRRCGSLYHEKDNNDRACSWHRGVRRMCFSLLLNFHC